MISLRLGEELERRISEIASKTGRTKTFFIREAIIEKIDDLEDIYLAERAIEEIKTGKAYWVDADEVWKNVED